jgi:hypothetical protein
VAPEPETFNWRGAAFVAAASASSRTAKAESSSGSSGGGGGFGGSTAQRAPTPLVPTITKAEYEELGADYSNARFRDW